MNDKDFLFWLQGVLEVKVKFNGSKDLEEILKDVKEHNEGCKLDVSGRSEHLVCDCNVKLAENTLQVYCPKCYKTHKIK